jgi:phenylacetic acid degradation operon negative regulatory protein
MLLTVLGEYVLPLHPQEGVWQEALVNALCAVGYSAQAARQAVARSSRDGWLVAQRHGRRARMSLTDSTAKLLSEGTARIYGFGGPWDWDGRWLLVAVRVPEHRRDIRHQLRSRLAWAGLGSLGGGLWMTPHVEREREIADALVAEPVADVVSFRAEIGALGDPERVVRGAWDLDAIAAHYDDFIGDFESLDPGDGAGAFAAQTAMVHAWRKFPFIDPDLPHALLPEDWPSQRAHELFHACHARWRDTAIAYFESLGAG